MFIHCKGCTSKLSWNHKTDKKLSELRCPHCGGEYTKRAVAYSADPFAKAELLLARFERAARRLETALSGAADLGGALVEAGELIQQFKKQGGELLLLRKPEGDAHAG